MVSFAENHLNKLGWEKGEGLGNKKKGIKKALAPVKKNDNKGIGCSNDNFEFPWWDHVYNKVSSDVKVEESNGKIEVKSNSNDKVTKNKMGIISTELIIKPSSQNDLETTSTRDLSITQLKLRAELYGSFVKSSEMDIQAEGKYITKISDKDLFEACGKLTARKGARADQSGKLTRVQNFNCDADQTISPTSEEPKEKKRKMTTDAKPKKEKRSKSTKKKLKKKKSKC